MHRVASGRRDIAECTRRFGRGPHRHQHPANVRVIDDRDRTARTGDRTALHALARKGDRLLVGALGDRDALHADGEARRVHHDEHVLEAAVLRADQVADRARADVALAVAVDQYRGRTRLDAELVLDRRAPDVVALARRAVGIHHEFRHDEQRDALDALRRLGRARQHQMDDVLGHVVLTIGDEDLLAEDLVGAVTLGLGLGAHLRRGPNRPAARSGSSCRSSGPRSSSACRSAAVRANRR